MNDKCSLDSINNNMKVIALIFLVCIFLIVVLYFLKNTTTNENFFTGIRSKLIKNDI